MHITIWRRASKQYTSQVAVMNENVLHHTLTTPDVAKKTCNQLDIILLYIYGNIWLINYKFFQMQPVTSLSVMKSSLFTTHFPCILLDKSLDWFTNARYLT